MYSQVSSSAFIAALNPVVSSCGLLSWIKLSGSKKYHHFRTPFSLPKSTCLIYRFRIAPLNNQYEKKKKNRKWSDILQIQLRETKSMSIKNKGIRWINLHEHKEIHSQFSPWLSFLLWALNNENTVHSELTSHNKPVSCPWSICSPQMWKSCPRKIFLLLPRKLPSLIM